MSMRRAVATPQDSLEQLAAEFFRQFARAEYCLKAAGFRKPGRTAQADWSSLAQEVAAFLEQPNSPDLRAAVDYLLTHPPKKQVVVEGKLDWAPELPAHDSQAELVLLLVCRIRNNLFHGGKFNGHWFAPDRSKELILHAGQVLQACLTRHPGLQAAYGGAAF